MQRAPFSSYSVHLISGGGGWVGIGPLQPLLTTWPLASVQYEHTPDHDVAAGHCLLCVGRPATSLVLEA